MARRSTCTGEPMNIFYLDTDTKECAKQHLDKHVVKMILEYAQLLSTAHRLLDGYEYEGKSISGRKAMRWKLDDARENNLYLASHMKHPSGIWCRQSEDSYWWLYSLWRELMKEYTFRYGKKHACSRLLNCLDIAPSNIPGGDFYPPTPAMPDECKVKNNSLASYHKYYIEKKNHFAKWTKREVPLWFANTMSNNANI